MLPFGLHTHTYTQDTYIHTHFTARVLFVVQIFVKLIYWVETNVVTRCFIAR